MGNWKRHTLSDRGIWGYEEEREYSWSERTVQDVRNLSMFKRLKKMRPGKGKHGQGVENYY